MKVKTQRRLSVVIPCYNEALVIDELLARLSVVCEQAFPGDFEIVLVNDGSTDSTWPMIREHAGKSAHIVGVNLARNHGHQLALSAGLKMCSGELIFILDADLQDPPELLPEMLEKIDEGYDVVYGRRRKRAGETLFKKATASVFYRTLNKLTDVEIPRDTGDFRLMTRRVLEQLEAMPERFRFIRGMVSWVGFNQTEILYDRDARFAGDSKYPIKKMVIFALDAITSFSIIPLRLAVSIGMLFAVAGMVALGWVMLAWFNGQTVEGWASVTSVLLVVGSLQMMMLGILGEYVGRIYMETKKRPLFIIDEVVMPEQRLENGNEEAGSNAVHQIQQNLRRAVNE